MRRTLKIAGLVLFGLALGLGGLEVALRVVGVGAATELDPLYDRSLLRLSPDSTRRNPWGRHEEDAMRVAVIGDSFTNAFANQWYDGYGQRLEHLLNLRDGARPVEVRVFAKNGTTTWEQLPLLDRVLNGGAELVILGIFLNDTQVKGDPQLETRSVRIPDGWRLELLRLSRALGWIYLRAENVRLNWTFKEHEEYLFSPANEGFRRFEGAIREFAEKTDRSGAGLVAVIWPNMFALGPGYPMQLSHDRIAQALVEAGVPYLDLLDEFRDKSPVRMAVYPGVDSHPSEIAHRVGATAIFSYLVAEGHLDGSYRPRRERPQGEQYWLDRVRQKRNRFGARGG